MKKYIEFPVEFAGESPYLQNKYILKRIENENYDYLCLAKEELFINVYATISGTKYKVQAYLIGNDTTLKKFDLLIRLINISLTYIDIPTNVPILIEIHNEVADD